MLKSFQANPILTIAGLISGGAAGAIDAFQKSNAAYQRALANDPTKARLLDLLTKTQQAPDWSRLIEGYSRNLGSALDAFSGGGYNAGQIVTGSQGTRASGIQKAGENSIAAQTAANLIQIQMQDEARRQQLQADIIQSPVFGIPDSSRINPGADAFLGLWAGGLGGLQSSLGSQFEAFTTNQQSDALDLLMQDRQQLVAPPIQSSNYGVGYRNPDFLSYSTDTFLIP